MTGTGWRKWLAPIALALAALAAFIARAKGAVGGARRQRLAGAKERRRAGTRDEAALEADVEVAETSEMLAEEAHEAGKVRRDHESQQTDASDSARAGDDLDDELGR